MHTFVDRYYLNDQSRDNRFNNFSAFPSMSNTSLFINPYSKTTMPVVNQGTHGPFSATQPQHLFPSSNPMMQSQPGATMNKSPFVSTGKSLFLNSASDLINNQIPKHTKEFYKTNQEIAQEEKKNTTKLQMMEEKMRGLELKSQRLEVINDFFFDMFENNLVKEELKKNQLADEGNELEDNAYDYNNEYYDEYDDYNRQDHRGRYNRRKQKKKTKNGRRDANEQLPTNESIKLNFNQPVTKEQTETKEEKVFDPKAFQQKTLKNATKVMKNLKKSVSDYICKNELFIYNIMPYSRRTIKKE